MDKLRIVFMGTPDFSVPSLESLAQAGYDIAAVYSQPDKQRGRAKGDFLAGEEKALELGIPVFQPDSMRRDDVIEQLRSLAPDVIIVIAYGKILPKAVLDIPKYGCLNVHGSLLPKYRGAAPIQYAVKDGEAESGVTIMLLDEGMDTGKMLKKAAIPLDAKETTGTLFDKLSLLGAQTLLDVLTTWRAMKAGLSPRMRARRRIRQKLPRKKPRSTGPRMLSYWNGSSGRWILIPAHHDDLSRWQAPENSGRLMSSKVPGPNREPSWM